MITETYIREYFAQVIEEAFEIFGLEGDELYVLRNSFLVIKAMRPMGTAHCITGEVKINLVFIGTELYSQLHDTIRHEVAHLVTPLEYASHGKEWKRNARLLRAVPAASAAMPKEYHNQFPVRIYALLENGAKVFIRAGLRKSSKYKKGTEHKFSVRGVQVKEWIIEEKA
jgi:hypothetical protein